MKKWLLSACALICACSTSFADITSPDAVAVHDPVVVTVEPAATIPAEARLRGSFQVTNGKYIQVGDNVFHCWLPIGKHTLTAQGVWVMTKSVTVDGQSFDVLLDFGAYFYTKEITVGPEVPTPDPFPQPQPLPGKRWAAVWIETATQTPAQGNLLLQLRKQYPKSNLLILDPSSPPASLKGLWDQRPPTLNPPVLQVIALQADKTHKVVRSVSLPASFAEVVKEIDKP